jgi:PRTRC genetic system protein E
MLQQLESLAEKTKITILVDNDNGKIDVVILCAYKDAKRKAEVFNPIFLSADAKSIDEKFNNAIKDLIAKDSLTKIEPITEPKKEKVVSKVVKKEIVKEEPVRIVQMVPLPPPPTKNKAIGTLTAKLSEEEIEAIEDSYARPEPGMRPRTPAEAFESPQLFAEEEECDDCGMQNDDDLFDDVPEEEAYFENETKNFILEQAESKGISKKMVEEKVIFATVAKPKEKVNLFLDEDIEQGKSFPTIEPKPIDDMELQAKDPMEQMKKNNGENYLNRKGKLIIQEVQDVMQEPTLKDRWDSLLEKAHTHGMKTEGLVFEQQTSDTIDGLEQWINSRIEAKNK